MAQQWRVITLLHNLQLEDTFAGNEHIAVVPPSDPRISEHLKDANFRRVVNGFTDQFKRRRSPAILIMRGRTRQRPEAITAFENVLAICAVMQARERVARQDVRAQYFRYSGYFDFYPYSLIQDSRYLVANTASGSALDDPAQFKGQTSPELLPGTASGEFYDPLLFDALMRRWSERHIPGARESAHNDALFNSLEMAYRASRMPHDNRGSLRDYGAQIGLWVSAFETLAWPAHAYAGLTQVLELIRPAAAHIPALTRRYSAPSTKGKKKALPIAEKIYCEMNKARNDFLHGVR